MVTATTATRSDVAAPRPRPMERLRRLLDTRLLLLVVVSYLIFRLFSAILMIWLAKHQDPQFIPFGTGTNHTSYWDMARMWDGAWYETIVRDGYPSQLPHALNGTVQQNPWAFYPLYPMMTKGLMLVTGGSFGVVGSLFSLVLGGAAMVLMAVLMRPRVGAAATLAATSVFAAAPPSPVFQMTYTESLGLLILMAFLIAISKESWLLAGTFALVCGFARPIAVPMALVALVAVVVRWRARNGRPIVVGEWVRMSVALVSCGVAGLIWPVIAWAVTGDRSAYTATESAWRTDDEVVPFVSWVRNFDILFGDLWGKLALLAVVVLLVAMLCGPWATGLGYVMWTWTFAYALYLAAVLDAWSSTYRMLIYLFPIVVILIGAGWKRRDQRVLTWVRTAACIGLFLGWQVWWGWTLLRLAHPAGNAI
ncbi:hypothetical protein [Leekyejoonella antrihumi]|uniref:Glycosyltransferase RgtA/B/C/D-like domain-containing protein n=1 Tax=Leekyejoonella antrihumi TaxID=1660198 RepID=A0A563DW86_9MICO|nr:hypothetical protein [Leekyejoonella antrihumi]TWP34540.1 hypothetical protein FGL98_16720 [Leekyejoonella antrihumi]